MEKRPPPIDKELYKRFRNACFDKEISLTDGLEEAVELWLKNNRM